MTGARAHRITLPAPVQRLLDSLGARRPLPLLRLAWVPLFAAAERLPPPGDHEAGFFAVLGAYLVWSLVVVWLNRRWSSVENLELVASNVDVVVISVLCGLSGGAYSLVRLGFFFVPVSVAFSYRPRLTLMATVAAVTGYVLQSIVGTAPSSYTASYVAVWSAMLSWVGVSAAVLSEIIARRTRQVERLAADRERLLAETMAAESRERQQLAEGLHDGAIQSLLAIRHDLETAAVSAPESQDLARADEALLGVVRQLRSAIFELHPHVLEAAGLEAAIRQVAEVAAQRGEFELALELDSLPRAAAADRVLFSVFRELITNVVKHARAGRVTVRLTAEAGSRTLTVIDDGRGFDADRAARQVGEGHIGLPSQRIRLETVGGGLEIARGERGGTVATAHVPV
jgi:two-component system NarL family sensor kinase